MTNENERGGSVYRFRDLAAMHIGAGPTEYLTPKEARALAKALLECAQSIEKDTFCDSSFETRSFHLLPLQEGCDTPDYKQTRKESKL